MKRYLLIFKGGSMMISKECLPTDKDLCIKGEIEHLIDLHEHHFFDRDTRLWKEIR